MDEAGSRPMSRAVARSLASLEAADQQAVLQTLTALLTGFQGRDADRLSAVYTDDADWVNAFGSVKEGAREIVDYLRGLLADANFNKGRLMEAPDTAFRVVSSDVVIASTQLRVRGQGLVGGGTISLRNNHSLHVLQRQQAGGWRVVSEIHMDARQDQSYINHS